MSAPANSPGWKLAEQVVVGLVLHTDHIGKWLALEGNRGHFGPEQKMHAPVRRFLETYLTLAYFDGIDKLAEMRFENPEIRNDVIRLQGQMLANALNSGLLDAAVRDLFKHFLPEEATHCEWPGHPN